METPDASLHPVIDRDPGDEFVEVTAAQFESMKRAWRERALDRGKCDNCGSTWHLIVSPVVPLDAGGELEDSNAIVTCRGCTFARMTVARGIERQPFDLFVHSELLGLLDRMAERVGTNRTELVRGWMAVVAETPEAFADLREFAARADGEATTRVHLHLDAKVYPAFAGVVASLGVSSVTAALKGLILMRWEANQEKSIG